MKFSNRFWLSIAAWIYLLHSGYIFHHINNSSTKHEFFVSTNDFLILMWGIESGFIALAVLGGLCNLFLGEDGLIVKFNIWLNSLDK